MEYSKTNIYRDIPLYLDIIFFSANSLLTQNNSVKIKEKELINLLIKKSPTIIGRTNRVKISDSIRDIYKRCYKNNHRKSKSIKLSLEHLKQYVEDNDLNIKGMPWV